MAAAAPAEQMASGSESGVVVRWMSGKGYGFVKPEGTEEQLFVHFRNFMQQRKTLNIGENVTFDRGVDERSGKARAVNVTGDFSGTEPEPFRGGRGGGRGGRGGFRGGRGRGRGGYRGRGRGRGSYGGRGGYGGGRGNSRNYSPYGDSSESYGGQSAYGGSAGPYHQQEQYGQGKISNPYGGQSMAAANPYGQQPGGNPYSSASSQYSQY